MNAPSMSPNDAAALARIPADCDCERDDDGQWMRCPACIAADRAAEDYDDGREEPAAGAEYAGAAYYAGPVDDDDVIPFP